jgi:hypothetical protein
MAELSKLLPKKSQFDVVFNNGKQYTLHLRPYTLRDEAYLRDNFDMQELAQGLQSLDLTLISKLVWRQLEPESKKIFDRVKAVDDDGNEVDLQGYEKLMESFGGVEQIIYAFNAVMKARGLNSVVDELMDEPSKKKTQKNIILRFFSIS